MIQSSSTYSHGKTMFLLSTPRFVNDNTNDDNYHNGRKHNDKGNRINNNGCNSDIIDNVM